MTQTEREEMKALGRILDTVPCGSKEWEEAYDRYFDLREKEDAEYKAENIGNLRKFFDEHIANREWKDIEPEAWDWYSDYHKDVFGYRPRTLIFPAE